MAEPVLELQGITKCFGALAVSRDISLTIHPGEVHALIGPNGAGKTTLVKQITGMTVPDAGRVLFQGKDMTSLSAAERAKAGIGRTFQISAALLESSLLENTMLAAIGRRGQVYRFWRPVLHDQALVNDALSALERVGLRDRSELLAAQLSHGERRQLEIAMALVAVPELLLLDEPMAGLGADGSRQMTALLKSFGQKIAMLLIEHDMDAVFALADRVSVLVDGAIIASGLPDEIRNDATVRGAYLGSET